MKNLIVKTILIFFILFGLQGCYTILWTPEKIITENFSSAYYYGYVSNFYDIPWWINVPIIVDYPSYPVSGSTNTKERTTSDNKDRGILRNNNGDRNSDGRNSEVINTPPPTINTGGNSGSTTTSGSSSSSSGSGYRTESSSSSSTNTRSSDTRSDSGTRNSGSGRK